MEQERVTFKRTISLNKIDDVLYGQIKHVLNMRLNVAKLGQDIWHPNVPYG